MNVFHKPTAISVVIPALNEQDTIAGVVSAALACDLVDEVVVANNGSTDLTAERARDAGARVVDEFTPGQGHALRTGYLAARNHWVIKLDADLDTFSNRLIENLQRAVDPGVGLVKGRWHDSNDDMPMTRLMVRPAIDIMFSGLSHIEAVNSGIFLFNRSLIAVQELTDGYAADLDIMLRIYTAGWNVAEVDIGEISHDPRNLQHYNKMAETLLRFMIDRHQQAATDSIVVVASQAEEVVAGCLGTLLKKLRSGGRVTLYLARPDTPAADLLGNRLTGFPTFSIKPLESANNFSVLAGRHDTTIIINHIGRIAESSDPLVNAAMRMYARYKTRNKKATLLMMPVAQGLESARGFRPDVRVDLGDNIEMVREIQEEICRDIRATRELFTGSGAAQAAWQRAYSSESIEAYQAFDHQDIQPPLVTL